MKTKEEILSEVGGDAEAVYKEHALKAMSEYAQQQSIAFAEWTVNNDYSMFIGRSDDIFWVDCSEGDWFGEEDRKITTSQLYTTFLSQQTLIK